MLGLLRLAAAALLTLGHPRLAEAGAVRRHRVASGTAPVRRGHRAPDSPVAGTGATLATAGARVPADASAGRAGGIEGACARHEARLRPWVEAAQRMPRRNVHLFAPANRFQLVAREVVPRLAARPFLVPVVRGLLNRREGERL